MRFAPKEVCLGKSMSLTYRICLAIGVNSTGHTSYLGRVLSKLGLRMSQTTRRMLHTLDERDAYFRIHKQKLEIKKRRSQLKNIHWRLELARTVRDVVEHGCGYGKGKDGENRTDGDNSSPPAAKKMRVVGFCSRCEQSTHLRSSSRLCPFNKKNLASASAQNGEESEQLEQSNGQSELASNPRK